MSSRSDSFLRLRLGWSTKKRGNRRARGVALAGQHLFSKSILNENRRIVARSSAEAELYATELGTSEAKGVESMICDLAALGASVVKGVQSMMCHLGFAVRPVLIIDAKATEHILHRHGIGENETHRRGAFVVAR